ncbi:hypothetical protein [Candidatus Uabimicrobium amorphum]|uniref:Uncharacterized protein n=1 Tax=Uabimicrobium amorphum TaxID=2596890 RepID=A0A5S9IQK5_UABAM|nr:hypothetical protein [Candidatus Uabimicrobium amorphum]BBM84865.1 hypothetical protein UABAM_03226 [Candidatus Uabimicrobium amorphum]
MNPEFLKMQLFGAVIPATICAIVVLVFARPWRKDIDSLNNKPYWSMALGMAAGYIFAYWAIVGEIPSFPVDVEEYDSDSWLIYIPFVLTLLAFAHNFTDTTISKGLFIAISAMLSAWLIVPEWIVDEGESSALLWYWRLGFTATAVVMFTALEKLTNVTKGRTFSLLSFFLATAASGVLVLSANAKMGQLCGAIAAMSMAMFVLSIVFKNISWASSGNYFLAIVLTGLLVNGYLSGEAPLISFALIAIAPIFCWGAQIKAIQKFPPIAIGVAQILFAFIPIITALLIAFQYYVD